MADMTRLDRCCAERSVSYDDLFFRNDLSDLIIVTIAILQAQNHCMVIDHWKSIAYSCFQELVVNEYDEQIYNADLFRISCSDRREISNSLAISVSRCVSVNKNSVLLDVFYNWFISVQNTYFML